MATTPAPPLESVFPLHGDAGSEQQMLQGFIDAAAATASAIAAAKLTYDAAQQANLVAQNQLAAARKIVHSNRAKRSHPLGS